MLTHMAVDGVHRPDTLRVKKTAVDARLW